MTSPSVNLILLAAGSGTRFGADKLSYPIDGVPMLMRTLRLYADEPVSSALHRRILVIQPDKTMWIEAAERLGFTVATNPAPDRGVSHSIRLGIEAVEAEAGDGLLFSVADQPYLTGHTVLRLIETFFAHPDAIVAPRSEDGIGNPVVFPMRYREELKALVGDRGGKQVLHRHMDRLITVDAAKRELLDVDQKPEEST